MRFRAATSRAALPLASRSGAIGLLLLQLGAAPVFAQGQAASQRGLSDVQICSEVIKRMAGAAAPGVQPIPHPVHVYFYEAAPAGDASTGRVLALLAFEPIAHRSVATWFRTALEAQGHVGQARVRICQAYTKSTAEQLSFPHQNLIEVGSSSSLWSGPAFRIFGGQYAVAFPRGGAPSPSAGKLGPGNDKNAGRIPPKNANEAKQAAKGAASPAKPDDPGVSSSPLPDTSAPPGDAGLAELQPSGRVAARPADESRRSLKLYPRPDYRGGVEPLLTAEPRENLKPAVFAVEEIQCGDDGNWLVGYRGQIETVSGDTASILLTQRHALNNYPGQRTGTLESLRADYEPTGGLDCDPGKRECSAPSFEKFNYAQYRQALLGRNRATSDQPRYICRPDQGICVSQERDYWRCDLDGKCLGYDPTRWWCAWRQEFCFSRVKFGDWGSGIKENDTVQVKLDGSERQLVYDMAGGFLRIAQDALTRVCGRTDTKLWKAHWTGPK